MLTDIATYGSVFHMVDLGFDRFNKCAELLMLVVVSKCTVDRLAGSYYIIINADLGY